MNEENKIETNEEIQDAPADQTDSEENISDDDLVEELPPEDDAPEVDEAEAEIEDEIIEVDEQDGEEIEEADETVEDPEVDEVVEADAEDAEAEPEEPEEQVGNEIEIDLDEPLEIYGDFEIKMENVIEAVLFASDEPLSAVRLINTLETGSVKQVRECIDRLNESYAEQNRTFRIEKIAGGYQMMTLNIFNGWLKKLLRVRTETKLSPAALETLAIVSYKQPILRADVEAIRGVASGEMIRGLMYKGLVKIAGRAEIIGRPMLYGTTKKFLDVFGLHSIKDLPKIEELKKPSE